MEDFLLIGVLADDQLADVDDALYAAVGAVIASVGERVSGAGGGVGGVRGCAKLGLVHSGVLSPVGWGRGRGRRPPAQLMCLEGDIVEVRSVGFVVGGGFTASDRQDINDEVLVSLFILVVVLLNNDLTGLAP
jgi:hypothetical protein